MRRFPRPGEKERKETHAILGLDFRKGREGGGSVFGTHKGRKGQKPKGNAR